MYLLPDGTSNLRNFDSASLRGRALLSSINGATTPWRGGRVEEVPLPGASCPLLAAFP